MSRVRRVRHQDTPLGFSQLLPVTLRQASCKSLFIANRCTDPGLCSCFTGRMWTANRCITKLLYVLFACAQHYTGSQSSDTATDITYLLQIRNIKCNHAWTDAYRYQTQLLKIKSFRNYTAFHTRAPCGSDSRLGNIVDVSWTFNDLCCVRSLLSMHDLPQKACQSFYSIIDYDKINTPIYFLMSNEPNFPDVCLLHCRIYPGVTASVCRPTRIHLRDISDTGTGASITV